MFGIVWNGLKIEREREQERHGTWERGREREREIMDRAREEGEKRER